MRDLKQAFVNPSDQSGLHNIKPGDNVQSLFSHTIIGSILSNSGVQQIISFDVPNDDLAFAIEVTAFQSRSGVGPVRNSKYEKTVFFINRSAGNDVDLAEGASFTFSEDGPDTGVGSIVNDIALTIQRAGAESATSSQEVEITADVNAGGDTAALGIKLEVIGSYQESSLSVNTNNLNV